MRALVVDDDLVLADVIAFTLRRAGFETVLAHDGEAALIRFDTDSPAVVILDVQLPKLDGREVCQRIRAKSNVPIVMLTVLDTDTDVVHGLGLGADDYITKPFSPAQLVARVQAVLRRSGSPTPSRRLSFADITLVPDRHSVERDGEPSLQLTPLEYKLLEALVVNSEKVLPTNILIDSVYGVGGGDKAMLKQLVYRLRKKLIPDERPTQTEIEAIPGVGYALVMRNIQP